MSTTTSATVLLATTLASYEAMEDEAAELHIEQVKRVRQNAIGMTARDTGQAQAGYTVTVGSPSSEALGPGRYTPPTSIQAEAALAGASLPVVKFVTNHETHVIFLELGTTRRAGDHMMERAVRAEAS